MLLEFPLTTLNINALTKPKPDIVFCVSLEEDSTDIYDEFDIPIDENKLILPVTKLWPLTSSYDTVDLQGGNGRIILPQLIVERKSSSRDFFNCQNQLFGGLFVILSAMCLASKLLNLENNPVVWGFVNIDHHMELWVMKKKLETVHYPFICILIMFRGNRVLFLSIPSICKSDWTVFASLQLSFGFTKSR